MVPHTEIIIITPFSVLKTQNKNPFAAVKPHRASATEASQGPFHGYGNPLVPRFSPAQAVGSWVGARLPALSFSPISCFSLSPSQASPCAAEPEICSPSGNVGPFWNSPELFLTQGVRQGSKELNLFPPPVYFPKPSDSNRECRKRCIEGV